jgi:hypothetical protein
MPWVGCRHHPAARTVLPTSLRSAAGVRDAKKRGRVPPFSEELPLRDGPCRCAVARSRRTPHARNVSTTALVSEPPMLLICGML